MTSAAIVGVDLGGTNVRVGKVRRHEIERRHGRRIAAHQDETSVLGEIFAAIDEVFDGDVAGIGCAVPSVVDVERGVVFAVENIPSWREVHLKDELEGRFGVPAFINNDANAFVLGELHFGKARGYRDVVGLTLGTGLGGGVVIDGRLYSGRNCGAGEIGMIPYREHIVEHYCAGAFFTREAGVAGDVVCERARQGDAAALRLFADFGHELAYALMIALYAYDPELIVFGGSISRAYDLFADALWESLRQRYTYRHALERLVIAVSETEDVAVLGAAALYLDATTHVKELEPR